MTPKAQARLLFASSSRNADMRYFTEAVVPDPFIALQAGGKKYMVVNRLEFKRLSKASTCVTLPLEKFTNKGCWQEATVALLRSFKIQNCEVPWDFPSGLRDFLRRHRIHTQALPPPFFPQRALKSPLATKGIKLGNKGAAAGIAAARNTLEKARIQKNYLYLKGRKLTSESLRALINTACLQVGCLAEYTICAGGAQACDPHEQGHGPLKAHELIIVDVFPRHEATGYYGDMTRTFLKGRASEKQKALVATVKKAQKQALAAVKAGVKFASVHRVAEDTFTKAGYLTAQRDQWEGFFHGIGHGLGLEVHEAPTFKDTLQTGQVITIEPGLYYPALGACRIEDVVSVQKESYQRLSSAPYLWHLR